MLITKKQTAPYMCRLWVRDSRSVPTFQSTYGSKLLANSIWNGTSNPLWKVQIAKGVDASTNFYRTGVDKFQPCLLHASARTFRSGVTAGYTLDSVADNSLIEAPVIMYNNSSTLQGRALRKLKRKLSDKIGQVNMMAPIAEIGELHMTIRKSVELTTAFLKVLAGNRMNAATTLAHFQDAWLTYNFGIAPLIRDTADLGNSIAKYFYRRDNSYVIRASAKDGGVYRTDQTVYGYAPNGAELVCVNNHAWNLSYKYTGAFDTLVESANDYSMAEHLGLTFNQLPATLWELTALSWIWDYFINIGEFLEDAFETPNGLTKYITLNRKYELTLQTDWTTRVIKGNPNNIWLDNVRNGSSHVHYYEFDRIKQPTALPHASLRFRTVDEIGKYGLSKLLNLCSILRVKR